MIPDPDPNEIPSGKGSDAPPCCAFTAGPWKWIERHKVLNSASGKIFDSAPYEGMWMSRYNDEEDDANARLIEAAPELFEELDALIRDMDDYGRRTEKARALLARIRGHNDQIHP